MAKKKDASPGSAGASVLRRSSRETPSRKQPSSSSVNSRKSERFEKHTSPAPSPVKNKLDNIEKQRGSSPLRRSDRGKKSVEIPDLPNIKSTKERTANNSKQCSKDDNDDKKTEKRDPDGGGRKRKRFTAIRYKALFKPQRIKIQSDDDEVLEVEDKSPQANTSRNEDVEKELKTQNSIKVQGAPDKGHKAILEESLIDLDQIEHGDCPRTKSLDGKSIESGGVEKKNGGNVSPSNVNVANSDNHMVHTPSDRIEHDLENQQEPDTCHKVTGTCKAAGIMENAENNDVSSNMQNSKFVEFWVPVQISNVQLEQYCATLLSNAMALCSSAKSDTLGTFSDVFIANRKCCNHPYIVDHQLHSLLMKGKERSTVLDIDIKASGKLQFLDHVLPEIRKHQLRVLILFQPTSGTLSGSLSLGQILVDYVHQRYGQNTYEHFDGVGNITSKKQAAINIFNQDMNRFIFLLESRACHPSIKLSVDVIIIFDSELNPSNDLKSLQKISIDSQSEQIMIFRFYSPSTLEERILKLAENNVAIDIRSQKLRSNYDALLTWGASDLFDKLTEFHSQTVLNMSSEESILKDVVEEFLYIISHKGKNNNTTSKSSIIQVQNCGIYGKNIPLQSEIKTHSPEGDQAYLFWRKLLEGRCPVWKFVSESTPRKRKRPSYFLDSAPKGKSGVNGGGVKTRRQTVNNNSTVEPAQLKTVTEGETGGVNEGVPAANDESQSSSGDQFWSTSVDNETSLLDLLNPTVSELCNILKLSEDVKIIVEKFLKFVLDNYQVGKEHTSAILQAFMISLCWMGSSLAKTEIDRSESFALAKKHFKFCCMEEEAVSVYEKLESVKETFLQPTQIPDCLKDNIPAPEVVKPETKKSQHIPNVDDAFENQESNENVSEKGKEEFENIKKEWDKKRASLENDYKVDKSFIHALYRNPSIRSEKLKLLEREFANKLKEHQRLWEILTEFANKWEDHERLWEIHIEDLKAMLVTEGQVAAGHEFSSHSGNLEVAPALAERATEAQSHDERVCEGANDIESTGSHTSEKVMVDVTVSSEQIGEAPAQQVGDDMVVDVAEKVESIHENADASHAVAENNETGVNDMAPRVDFGYGEMPAGNCNKENDEDGTVGLDTSHADEEHHKTVDYVAPEVECAETGMPAGTHVVEDRNETGANDMAPRDESGDMEMPDGNHNKGNDEDRHETVDDVAPEVECAETGTPAGTHVVEDRNQTGGNDTAPRDESADMEMPDRNHHKENDKDRHEPLDDMAPEVVSTEMVTPGGTCNKESPEEGEIFPDTPDVSDDHNETSPNDVVPCVESAELATPAGNEENIEDSIIRPVASHANEDHNESGGSNSSNPVCAAISQDKTPSTQPVPSPASDHLEPIIPEIQNEPFQPEQLPDNAVQDDQNNVGDLQPPGASQPDQIILDDEPDFPSSTDPSDTLPSSGPLLEPICEEPTVTVQQSGENLEETLGAAVETPHEEHQPRSATSVEPAPPVNALNMFDNLPNRVTSQTDPLQAEVERLNAVKDNVTKFHQETKQRLDSECEKEIAEIAAQIRLKYEAKHVEADAAYNSKKMELEANINKVRMNKILAEAFRSKCQDLTPSGHTGMQQVSQAGLMQQLRRLSVSPSNGHYQGSPSSSPGQSSGNQQPLQPPPPPLSLPQPPPLQTPQMRPRQQPLQVVHQPAALFSSRPSPMVNQITSTTPPTTTRQPPIIKQITPSTTPTASRPRPTINPTTPSSTPATIRPPPGVNTMNSSTLPNRSPLSIAQIDMSAANLRINTETRRQSQHTRPLVSNEPRAPAPHMRPLVSNEPRAPAPPMRPLVSNEPRAPAPHLRAAAPHIRPFRSPPSVSADIGTYQRILPRQHVTSGPPQSTITPPPSTSSPQSLLPLPSEPVIVTPQPPQPPPSEPITVLPSPPSEQTPLLSSFDNLNGLVENAPRWVNVVTPQPEVRSQSDRLNITGGTAQSSSAHYLVCLSDDD